MNTDLIRLRFAERLMLPLFLLVSWAATAVGDSVSVFRSADPAGQHVVLIVPAPPHEASIG